MIRQTGTSAYSDVWYDSPERIPHILALCKKCARLTQTGLFEECARKTEETCGSC